MTSFLRSILIPAVAAATWLSVPSPAGARTFTTYLSMDAALPPRMDTPDGGTGDGGRDSGRDGGRDSGRDSGRDGGRDLAGEEVGPAPSPAPYDAGCVDAASGTGTGGPAPTSPTTTADGGPPDRSASVDTTGAIDSRGAPSSSPSMSSGCAMAAVATNSGGQNKWPMLAALALLAGFLRRGRPRANR